MASMQVRCPGVKSSSSHQGEDFVKIDTGPQSNMGTTIFQKEEVAINQVAIGV